ncbi:MAG: hypothetical protein ACFE9D_01240 [Promethearchaeota archaeon]
MSDEETPRKVGNEIVTKGDCNDIVTIEALCRAVYEARAVTPPCNITTTTTTTHHHQEETNGHDIVTSLPVHLAFKLCTDPVLYRLYHGKAAKEAAAVLSYFTLYRAAATIHSLGILDDKIRDGIFAEREEVHRVMRKLERLGLVTISLHKPFQGGRDFALFTAVWATSADVQMALEEHNSWLERHKDTGLPAQIPDEQALIGASLPEPSEVELRQERLQRIAYYESRYHLSDADQQVLARLKKQVEEVDLK